jgi:ubiquinone/menaquinone biosynthesis C-methylase UbiE
MVSGGDRTTEVIRHHWDRRAGSFDDETGHGLVSEEQRQAWLALLSRLVQPAPQRVLDVGCGTGFLALRFAELGHSVAGVDLAPQMIERARTKAQESGLEVDFRVGDGVQLDFPDETFNVVVARHVIWNLPDPERGVAEWLRVLRPGGRLLLVEGKWADNEALQQALARPGSRIFARAIDLAAAAFGRGRGPAAKLVNKLLNRKYRRVEAQLPFSGGPEATHLADFLKSHSVYDVSIEPLMDPTLWGESPDFPRYLVAGSR